ncbi:hypothetical protein G6F55_014003 [Rhizopus delemar]|uniref:Lipoprotein n=1 Tax=Rhizopus delemar TaxID=936053 RepID=A0A9P6XY99_9FUNG|nr:hypothetical protein G6F55_014003 [Rhizopus delemar]KAG1535236.1 hypothetical protein G6F50_015356 [Rhizopus delemar]
MSKLRRPTLALAIIASLSLAACDRPADPAAGTAAPADAAPAAAKPMLGSFGFDASGMDRSIAAGDDFFGFANASTSSPRRPWPTPAPSSKAPPATPRPAATTS